MKKIFKGNDDGFRVNSKLLSKLLISESPKEELKARLCYNLTSNSLQSKDQILKIAAYFDIPSGAIVSDFNELHRIFLERNKIIHEMDINFEGDRSRNKRELNETVGYINKLLELGEKFVLEIDQRLIHT
ncbi:hypothetical protein [Mucilaginibacter sp. HD30]